jgi:hypothetical protein
VVECQLPKLDVAGSNPVSRSNFSPSGAGRIRVMACPLLKIEKERNASMTMKRRTKTTARGRTAPPTLQDLVAAVYSVAQDEQLSATVVANLINSGRVRLHGDFKGKRVVVV